MVSLKDINEKADDRYAPLIVEDVEGGDVVLRNLIRCTENEIDQASKLQGRVSKAQKDQNLSEAFTCARELLNLVAIGDGAERFFKAVDNDSAKIMLILEMWAEATQPGEALRSEG